MKKHLAPLLFAVMLLGVAGCKTAAVTGQPTAPTQGYQTAEQAMSSLSADLLQAQQAEINLKNGGVIDKPTHDAIQKAFQQIGTYGKQADALIAAEASSTTIRAKINSALEAVTAITLQTGKLDTSTAAQLTNAVNAIKLLLSSVLDALPTPISEVMPYGPSHHSDPGRAVIALRVSDLQTSGSGQESGCRSAAYRRDTSRGRRELRPNYRCSGRGTSQA